MNIFAVIAVMFGAFIPVFIWGYIFYSKEPVSKKLATRAFIFGMISVLPLFLYKWSWQFFPELDIFARFQVYSSHVFNFGDAIALPASVVLSFMFVGILEEVLKNLAVRFSVQGKFKTIDECIEYSIIAALGFAFIENAIYFASILQLQGVDSLMTAFIFRAVFSTFAHILFSAVFGYFYAVAYFAEPIYKKKLLSRKFCYAKIVKHIYRKHPEELFSHTLEMEGLFLAAVLHALFNIFLEMDITSFLIPFLIIGYILLTLLLKKKNDHVNYKRLMTERSPLED